MKTSLTKPRIRKKCPGVFIISSPSDLEPSVVSVHPSPGTVLGGGSCSVRSGRRTCNQGDRAFSVLEKKLCFLQELTKTAQEK